MKKLLLIIGIAFCIAQAKAQFCTNPGQTPSTAFPVCGVSNFVQNTVPICGGKIVPGCPDGMGYEDKNPYWYKFTCYTAGTLGFVITPNNLADDYDWQLFDITGSNPDAVFTNAQLIVSYNWSGESGKTGASAAGTSLKVCGGPGRPTFSTMPSLIQGHEYLLLVSHFSDSQSGYTLSFGGGTSSITQPGNPGLQSADVNCSATTIRVKLNKRIKCSSLAANGSDFNIAGAVIAGASGFGCSGGFDTDSLVLTTATAMPPGNYALVSRNGTDGNTLLDFCNNSLPVNDTIRFTVLPVAPLALDSMAPVTCAPKTVTLVFRKKVSCASIAPNGSDFIVNGTTAVSVSSAAGSCSGGLTNTITVSFAAPIETTGTYQLQVVQGSDGNTIIDECGLPLPAGSTIGFNTKDTVNARFTYDLHTGCRTDTVNFHHAGGNGIDSWKWRFDQDGTGSQQNPTFYFTKVGDKSIQLIVSNGFCSDTASQQLLLSKGILKAGFTIPAYVCPTEPATFQNTSIGNINSWNWNFGDGTSSPLKDPPPKAWPVTGIERSYITRLIVQDTAHCADTATRVLIARANCYIAVPTAFTPNKDGKNDYLYPANAYKADNLDFRVFNRFGQLVWQTKNWTIQWDGTVNGIMQPPGTYVWILSYTHHDTGQKFFEKGTTVLIR